MIKRHRKNFVPFCLGKIILGPDELEFFKKDMSVPTDQTQTYARSETQDLKVDEHDETYSIDIESRRLLNQEENDFTYSVIGNSITDAVLLKPDLSFLSPYKVLLKPDLPFLSPYAETLDSGIGSYRKHEVLLEPYKFLSPYADSAFLPLQLLPPPRPPNRSRLRVASFYGTYLSRHIQEGDGDWAYFLRSGKKRVVKELLQKGALPNQRTLDEICLLFGRKSKVTLHICKAICAHIKSKHKSITNVWAAYTLEVQDKITFVVCLQKEETVGDKEKDKSICLHKIIEYSFVKRINGEYSHEGTEVMNNNVSYEKDIDDYAYSTLKDCVAKYSVEMMKKHKYLSIISASSKRSTGYGSRWNMKQENCIVLYVHTKHYIPINEEPFKTHYDGIPIDVREGAFIPFGRTATEFLEHVQMGSQIRGEVNNGQYVEGTLGCFIDHPQYGVCGLTCAHVLLSSWELLSLQSAYYGTLNWPLHGMCKTVYQPANQTNDIGHTVQFVYKEGSENSSGMEIALFKLTSRHPTFSDFPDPSVTVASSATININYEHWRICSADKLNSATRHVIKFGSKTELRDGIIEFGIVSVKELNSLPLAAGYTNIKLHKQIEVRPKTPGVSFAENGDSGALVFLVGANISDHTCIGIVEGGTSYGTVVVSPIVPILQELKVSGLKNFDSEQALSQVHGKIECVGNYLSGELQTVENYVQTLNSEMQSMRGEIQNIGSGLQVVQRLDSEVQRIGGEIQRVQTIDNNVQEIHQMLSSLFPAIQSPTSPNT